MFVTVVRWNGEKPGSASISYAFTGTSRDETIQRALKYRRTQEAGGSGAYLLETLTGELDAIVATPKVTYDLVPIEKES